MQHVPNHQPAMLCKIFKHLRELGLTTPKTLQRKCCTIMRCCHNKIRLRLPTKQVSFLLSAGHFTDFPGLYFILIPQECALDKIQGTSRWWPSLPNFIIFRWLWSFRKGNGVTLSVWSLAPHRSRSNLLPSWKNPEMHLTSEGPTQLLSCMQRTTYTTIYNHIHRILWTSKRTSINQRIRGRAKRY